MIHIRQIGSSFDEGMTYSIVYTKDWLLPLEQHPSIIEHPESFEIVDCEPPIRFDTLIYQSDNGH